MKRAFAILLAVIFLMGNMSFTVTNHFCGGKVMESALLLGHQDFNCGMANMDNECESPNSGETTFKKHCCENEYNTFDIADDFVPGAQTTDINVTFTLAFVYTYLQSLSTEAAQAESYTAYSPPRTDPDFRVLFQTFLI